MSLEALYKQIHTCCKCHGTVGANIKPDREKVQKKVFKQNQTSKLFIIGQSLASNQVRLSGISFHNPQGVMSRVSIFFRYCPMLSGEKPNRKA
jgi:uracil-DNA glycosylase